ncbi:HAD family phosphatase [Prevotella sp. 10(H)]|uniref:HAD family hydrolase n=1 Tax=Prevotella sp. 10(H) TaxID=1158294 RepID=UPI0004A7455C|nr:HAD family phosphatase [Prevotella sp. 10(H)]
MAKISTVLFDFDGVITNTEPLYDTFFDGIGEKYNLGYKSFAAMVKGVTMPNIVEKYLSHLSANDLESIINETEEFEKQMDFPPIAGALEFIDYLKKNNYKIGLVTSSQDFKMKIALDELNLTGVFDTEVTADRITQGKPDPMCYLLAAKDLNVSPDECIVFEDSFFGIQSGLDAGMKVVGLSTTNSDADLRKMVNDVIPDFSDMQRVLKLLA